MNKRYPNGALNLIVKTWDKDTNGLFDYSSKQTINSKETIENSATIIRKDNFIKASNDEPKKEALFNVSKNGANKYLIENKIEINMEANVENIAKINNKFWYVVNDNQSLEDNNKIKNRNKNYYLVKNDIIKLGRLKFVLTEDSFSSGDTKFELSVPNKDSTININNSKTESVFNLVREVQCLDENNQEEKILCRICYLDEVDKENDPMVHLCNCKGGINYAHFNCIKHWMKTKLIIIGNMRKSVRTYYIPRFNCEICKAPYPFKFKLSGKEDKIYELIDIVRPSNNYIILESLDQIKENNNNKYIHVIEITNENDITIGRGIEADIKINDISVSRLHSKLNFNFNTKSLLIRDLKSKFGTLVLIKNSFELKEKESLIVQHGRSLINLKVFKGDKKKKIFDFKKIYEKKEKKEINENKINEEKLKNKEITYRRNFFRIEDGIILKTYNNEEFKSIDDVENRIDENESFNNSFVMNIEQ